MMPTGTGESWADLLAAYMGLTLSKQEVKLWASELERDVRNVTNEELCDAIRAWSRHTDGARQSKVTLKSLRIWVYWYRKQQRAAQGSPDVRESLRPVMLAIDLARDDEDIWALVCEGLKGGPYQDVDKCMILEDYARRRHPQWRRPAMPPMMKEYERLCAIKDARPDTSVASVPTGARERQDDGADELPF